MGPPVHVVGGSASTALAERISRELGNVPFAFPFMKRFPDGEMYVRVGGRMEGEDAIVVQSTRSDENLMELLLLEDAVREAGAQRVFVVIPYFGTRARTVRSSPESPSARGRWRGTWRSAPTRSSPSICTPTRP